MLMKNLDEPILKRTEAMMHCIYCQGTMERKTAPFQINRKGYHLVLSAFLRGFVRNAARPTLKRLKWKPFKQRFKIWMNALKSSR